MFSIFRSKKSLVSSKLFDQKDFYEAFLRDLDNCKNEVIIESPFITRSRVSGLLPIIQLLTKRGVKVIINTRDPIEHDAPLNTHAEESINKLQILGVKILFTGKHHRKLSIIDRRVLWEGSLNILSQSDSCEIMRRTNSRLLADQMLRFTGLDRFLR